MWCGPKQPDVNGVEDVLRTTPYEIGECVAPLVTSSSPGVGTARGRRRRRRVRDRRTPPPGPRTPTVRTAARSAGTDGYRGRGVGVCPYGLERVFDRTGPPGRLPRCSWRGARLWRPAAIGSPGRAAVRPTTATTSGAIMSETDTRDSLPSDTPSGQDPRGHTDDTRRVAVARDVGAGPPRGEDAGRGIRRGEGPGELGHGRGADDGAAGQLPGDPRAPGGRGGARGAHEGAGLGRDRAAAVLRVRPGGLPRSARSGPPTSGSRARSR